MTHPNDPICFEQMPDGFPPSLHDLHNLEETNFRELNDGPPPHFDDENLVVLRRNNRPKRPPVEPAQVIVPLIEQRRPLSEVQFMTSPPANSFVEVAIARSVIGHKQVSLLSEKTGGEHQRYAVKVKSLLFEPGEHTLPLIESVHPDHKQGEPGQIPLDVPLALDAALVVFNAFVEKEFPAERLKNDKVVPIHKILLYPKATAV